MHLLSNKSKSFRLFFLRDTQGQTDHPKQPEKISKAELNFNNYFVLSEEFPATLFIVQSIFLLKGEDFSLCIVSLVYSFYSYEMS